MQLVEIVRLLNLVASLVKKVGKLYKKHKLEEEYEKAKKDPVCAFSEHFGGGMCRESDRNK